MGKRQPIGPGLAMAWGATRGTYKGVAAITRFGVHHWRPLLPLLCLLAAVAFEHLARSIAWAYAYFWGGDPLWAWVLAWVIGGLLLVMADDQVGQMRWEERPTPVVLEVYTLLSAIVLVSTEGIGWYAIATGACVLMFAIWKRSTAFNRFKVYRDGQAAMERCLAKMGISDDTRVSAPEVKANGSTVWQVYLGDNDRIEHVKVGDIAHMLKTDPACVIVTPAKGSTRKVQITHLVATPDKSSAKVHPACVPEHRQSGGAWEPGKRSITEGLPIGTALGAGPDDDPVATIRVYNEHHDSRSIMMLGKSGSGKTNTTSASLLSLIACNDAVVGVADVPKRGNLAAPFAPALHRIATSLDEVAVDLERLYALAQDRAERIARGEVRTPEGDVARNWVPSPEMPAVVYDIDELANTLLAATRDDPEAADDMWSLLISLIQFVRQFGIILITISQTAKKAMIPTDFTSQIGSFVVHQLKKKADAGDIPWDGEADFLESGLPKVGMSYIGQIDGGAPVKAMSYDMDRQIGKESAWAKVIADYVPHRPVLSDHEAGILGWGGALYGSESAPQAQGAPQGTPAIAQAPEAAVRDEDRRSGLLLDAVDDDPEIPPGAGIIGGRVPLEDGDEDRRRTILNTLAAEGGTEGLKRARLDKAIGSSRSTTRRVLQGLIDDELVSQVGQGAETRYRLAEAARVAA